ncbi:MAG TPA: glycoside hydrolase family 1 protein [Euryarchaeota archaeon]|nr:glycoside hydrolase family 1 protein [Euryarchaeota archaeon]
MIGFSNSFLFGTATSAHQIEGNNVNSDWYHFEEIGKLPFKSGLACNHWNKMEEDTNLMKELGYNAYRFSIEWARIFPSDDKVDQKAIGKYKMLENLLLENDIEPFVTLYHFTLPKWFSDLGGFEKEENLKYWRKYVEIIPEILENTKNIMTINEPVVYVVTSYLLGDWPPFKRNVKAAFNVARGLLEAHAYAYDYLKDHGYSVGIVKNVPRFVPGSDKNRDKKARDKIDLLFNWAFLNALFSGKLEFLGKKADVTPSNADFIGLNYYNIFKVWHSWNPLTLYFRYEDAGVSKRTQMGWSVYPQGIYESLKDLHNRYSKPLYVSENGIATLDDEWRKEYIVRHLQYVHKALKEGIDVRGYFYWSLMDNFEWDKGFRPRFGLIEINYETFERIPRGSAYLYGEIAKNKAITGDILEKYGIKEIS